MMTLGLVDTLCIDGKFETYNTMCMYILHRGVTHR